MKQAVILAAGEGQRLRPFTVTKPKSMICIAGKPILGYVVEALVRNGIRNIVLVVGYKKEQVYDYIGSGEEFGINVTYVTQERQLGAAHALAQAKNVVDDEFLVLPGDKLIEADTIDKVVNTEPESVLVKKMYNPSRYSVLTVENGLIVNIGKPAESSYCLVDTGIFVFSKDIFKYIEPELIFRDALSAMITSGKNINAYEVDKTWLDVVYPWDILSLNSAILHRIPSGLEGTIEGGVSVQGQVSVGKDSVIRSNSYIIGPVVIGEGCEIGPNVCIFPATSIANNVVISPFTEVKNCVIGDDVNIGPGSIIEDSVIDKGCVIGARFTACGDDTEVKIDSEHHNVKVGAMLGEGCNLGDSVTAESGVIVGNYSSIKAMNLINGRLPDRSMVI